MATDKYGSCTWSNQWNCGWLTNPQKKGKQILCRFKNAYKLKVICPN